jgi:hypothetical protein
MQTFSQFLEGKDNKKGYDYSSIIYLLPDKIAKKVYDWGVANVDEEDIFHNLKDATFGREKEMHCTVIYGIHDKRSVKARELLKGVSPFEIKLGKITAFTVAEDFDVLKVDVTSPALHKLHYLIRENLECTIKYPEFKPHVTIGYMKKGQAEKYMGEQKFQGLSAEVNELVFSSSAGIKTPIRLSG